MLVLLLVACGSNEVKDVDLDEVLSPLEPENLAEALSPADGETSRSTGGKADDWSWAHLRGMVNAGPDEVWGALLDPAVLADRRNVDSWDAQLGVEPSYDHSFELDYTKNVFITVEWSVLHVHQVQDGPPDAPQEALVYWEVSEGPESIEVTRGSARLLSVEPGWSEVELMFHVQAPFQTEQTSVDLLQDLYDDIVDHSHGRDLQAF